MNGTLYPYISLSDCLNMCSELSTCVAVDVSAYVCVVHTNVDDMATKFNASGFTQYMLHRACLSSTPTTASSTSSKLTASTRASVRLTSFGKSRMQFTVNTRQ